MTQFILPSASVSVTIVIPHEAFDRRRYSLGVSSQHSMWALEGDFRLQLGATLQEVLESLAFGKQGNVF